jgi:hypothetical protein
MDSAGVECGSKMVGTGLSLCGLALHNAAAKSTPISRTNNPTARATIAPQYALCVVSSILLSPSLARRFCHESFVHFATQLEEATRLPNIAVVSDVKEADYKRHRSAVCQPVEHDVPMLTA